jgi:Na+/proline symporter
MGIGALAGVTTGIIIAVADVTGGGVPVGYYVLRDAGYGTWIGAAVGALVGALLWVDDGKPRDLLQGAAYGSLFGAVAGVAYGIIEGKNASPPTRRYDNDWRFSVSPINSPRSPGIAAMLAKRF